MNQIDKAKDSAVYRLTVHMHIRSRQEPAALRFWPASSIPHSESLHFHHLPYCFISLSNFRPPGASGSWRFDQVPPGRVIDPSSYVIALKFIQLIIYVGIPSFKRKDFSLWLPNLTFSYWTFLWYLLSLGLFHLWWRLIPELSIWFVH